MEQPVLSKTLICGLLQRKAGKDCDGIEDVDAPKYILVGNEHFNIIQIVLVDYILLFIGNVT
jgi:hypothetical protein